MKKNIVLSNALGFTKREAANFVEQMQRVGLIPASLEVSFVKVPSGPTVGRFVPKGSTAGAKYLVRDRG